MYKLIIKGFNFEATEYKYNKNYKIKNYRKFQKIFDFYSIVLHISKIS